MSPPVAQKSAARMGVAGPVVLVFLIRPVLMVSAARPVARTKSVVLTGAMMFVEHARRLKSAAMRANAVAPIP